MQYIIIRAFRDVRWPLDGRGRPAGHLALLETATARVFFDLVLKWSEPPSDHEIEREREKERGIYREPSPLALSPDFRWRPS